MASSDSGSSLEEREQFVCGFCSKVYNFRVLLKDHVRLYHLNKDAFKCYHCKFTTNYKCKLAQHVKRHFDVKRVHRKTYTCVLCSSSSNAFQCHERQHMLRHYKGEHELPLVTKEFVFNCKEEFLQWTSALESSERCKFISPGGARRTKTTLISTLRCFRDGFFHTKGQGKRHLKRKKSSKIGGLCPASITASQDLATGVVRVKYIGSHVGHDTEVGRLRLTEEERKYFSSKIAAGVPFDTILDEVRNTLSTENQSEISRVHLLNRKDLWNIAQTYKLNCVAVRHESDAVSVASWVAEMKQNSNIVRFYKSQHSLSPVYEELEETDFVLIIATDTQLALLKEYGPKCICFDSTHGFNQYGFDLTTVLVLNQANQGFPCGYMVSNRSNAQFIKIFVETLKNAMDFSFQPEVMMTDMAENFYNGWCQVMPAPKHWLFCCWHVDHSWRKNLKKVSDLDKRIEVYRNIRTLLEHLDENTFPQLLNNTIKKLLADPSTKKFGEYFEAEYSGNFQSWSFCYRKNCGINTNMHLESMHKILKHLYLKGKKVKRLDKGLHALMRFTRDKLFDILLSTMRGKLTPKIVATRLRHQKSLALRDYPVTMTEAGWTISSEHGHEMYEVTRNDGNCCCDVVCEDCRVCVHTFKCTCPDSAIKTNICKHIHRVCLFLQDEDLSSAAPVFCDDEDSLDDQSDLMIVDTADCLPDSLLQDLSSKPSTSDADLKKWKQKLMQKFSEILDMVTSDSHARIVDDALRPVIPTIQASTSGLRFPEKKYVNPRANVSPQKNFVSTKKQRQKNDGGLTKPSVMERTIITARMLLNEDNFSQNPVCDKDCSVLEDSHIV